MHHYTREELEAMNCIELDQIANERELLEDKDEDDDLPDELLIGMILDDQNEQQLADEEAEDKQRAEDDRDPRINRRDGQDGSDDYC
ncbi:hypothetical protein HOT49_gp259 [Erwinia phage vB_EamM_Alexandra]|uniref:Uncharacterized protein n=1 Tax=Erwinia phage vB_EamM_Alexandra TaxID=2201424 RepID=A0A2Z4QE47_9CAUD|nr:hypothetical protein HOT49_gp259 [Erwinia phage vB_EamM_Alexandra]AWY08518.1 hypothetical protein Alexandra_261 [Erwinia phage vB_EamM_Alexandra]